MTAWCCRILRNDKSIIDKDTKAKATFNLAIAVLSYDKGPPYKYMHQDFPAPTYEVEWYNPYYDVFHRGNVKGGALVAGFSDFQDPAFRKSYLHMYNFVVSNNTMPHSSLLQLKKLLHEDEWQ
jgi:hypothetical protein